MWWIRRPGLSAESESGNPGQQSIPRNADLAHLVVVVQSDVAVPDNVQQRGFAVIQPGNRAWLVAVTDPRGGRIDDLQSDEPRVVECVCGYQ